jgi:glutamyl/glutaminyl-tRNA synthetase
MVADRWNELAAGTGMPVTRFAPSPTGHLHAGHRLHVEWLAGIARVIGARVLIRVEDHDRSRCTPEFEQSILAELDRSGHEFDPVSRISLNSYPSPYRQSDNPERYQAAFDKLQGAGLLYGCTCTRKDLGPPDQLGDRHYRGTCRGQPVERSGPCSVRVMLPDEQTVVKDLILGEIKQHPLQDSGDPVIRDAKGQWTYQLSVVVDDLIDDVNLIVRGMDLVSSTGRQLLLSRLLGRTTSFVTVHHPLLLDGNGKKVSKRTIEARS